MEEKWSDRVAYSRRSDQIVERAVRMVGSELNRTRRKRRQKTQGRMGRQRGNAGFQNALLLVDYDTLC